MLFFFTFKNRGLSYHLCAIFKGGFQLYVFICHRQNAPCDGQHLAQAFHRRVKAGHNTVQRRQKEIAEALARQGTVRKTIAH